MSNLRALHLLPLLAAGLSACQKPAEAPVTDATTIGNTTGNTVLRQDVSAPAAAAPAAYQRPVIQTQQGPSGSQVELNKVAVTGDILTVQLTYVGGSAAWQTPSIDQVNVIDDATAQRIGVLKDGEGTFMASPVNTGVKTVMGFNTGKDPQVVWFKFPAPPATSKTVSINIPEVAPFDGVPVTR